MASITYLLTKLANLGVFPSAPPISRSEPSFWLSTLPVIRGRFHEPETEKGLADYSKFWHTLLNDLPSELSLQTMLTSLFASLYRLPPTSHLDSSRDVRALVHREAILIFGILGRPSKNSQELWKAACAVMLFPRGSVQWHEGDARLFTCLAADSSDAWGKDYSHIYHIYMLIPISHSHQIAA